MTMWTEEDLVGFIRSGICHFCKLAFDHAKLEHMEMYTHVHRELFPVVAKEWDLAE